MATRTLALELPDELVALLGPPEAAVAKAKEALVLELLREARISQSQAADLLGVTRWEILERMAEHAIPSGPATPGELDQEVADLRRYIQGAYSPDLGRATRGRPVPG